MKCTQRLYLSKDRKKLVAEGDKAAASLYAVPGDEIPQSAADKFGLVDGALKKSAKQIAQDAADAEAAAKDAGAGQDKEQKDGSDKEQKSGDDKAQGGSGNGAGQGTGA